MTCDPTDRDARYRRTLRDVCAWFGSKALCAAIDADPAARTVHVTLAAGDHTATVRNLQRVPRPLLRLCLDLTARELARRVRDDLWDQRWATAPDRCEAMLDEAAGAFLAAIEGYERKESDGCSY